MITIFSTYDNEKCAGCRDNLYSITFFRQYLLISIIASMFNTKIHIYVLVYSPLHQIQIKEPSADL